MKEIRKEANVRQKILKAQKSPLKTYMEFTVGDVGFFKFVLYELLTGILGPMPGALGFLLRKKFYPILFRKVGRGVIVGRNVVIRHPAKIEIGNNVTIDDNCLIDAHGAGEEGLVLEDQVIVNRNSMLQAKLGPIRLAKRTSIGSYNIISSLAGVYFGEAVLTGGKCYFSAGAYYFDNSELPIMDQGPYAKGPIRIDSKSYLGAGSMVVGNVHIGEGAVVGAGAVVVKDVPSRAIVAGVPAKLLKMID